MITLEKNQLNTRARPGFNFHKMRLQSENETSSSENGTNVLTNSNNSCDTPTFYT